MISSARPERRPARPASKDVDVTCASPWLVVRFAREHRAISWALVGGGVRTTRAVVWHQIRDDELRPPVDAHDLFATRLRDAGHAGAIGLLTSRAVDTYDDVTIRHGAIEARCVATVGLGNALRAGDPPGPSGRIGAPRRIGTINLLCRVSVPLTGDGLLEGLALATEARALAVHEAGVTSTVSGLPASGTGTDCVVIAAPRGDGVGAAGRRYAGKHTDVGHVIGASVREAVARGCARWLDERRGGAR
jgi:adenosylcobinamide amidohydrolase